MSEVFIFVIISSAVCTLCGLSVLLLNRLVRGVSQRLRCGILTLAVVLPYAGVLVSGLFMAVDTTEPVTVSVPVSEEIVTEYTGSAGDRVYAASPVSNPVITVTPVTYSVLEIAGRVWLAVAVILLMRRVVKHMRLNKLLRSERTYAGSIGRVRVYSVGMKISPFLTGVFKPSIYIPEGVYSEYELKLVTGHETAHYRRFDLERRLIITVLCCINWFNPIYRYVLKRLALQTEYACDEAVTSSMDREERRVYGYMLLKTAESRSEYLSIGLGSDAQSLKRRLELIMKNKKHTKTAGITACAAAAVSIILCAGGCGAAMAVAAEPQITYEDEGTWFNKYYSDRSQVPEKVLAGRYYRTNGDENDYIELYDNGTLRIFSEPFFGYLDEMDKSLDPDEEGRRLLSEERAYIKQTREYVYLDSVGVIQLVDSRIPDSGEVSDRLFTHWYAALNGQYDIVLDGDDNFTYRYSFTDDNIKSGYYKSDSDDSYLYISDGFIELKGYDIDSKLSQRYRELTESGYVDENELSFEEFYENSMEDFREHSAGRVKYTIELLPSAIMLATQAEETGSGGGTYIGYIVIDENTIHGHGNYYTYAGESLE